MAKNGNQFKVKILIIVQYNKFHKGKTKVSTLILSPNRVIQLSPSLAFSIWPIAIPNANTKDKRSIADNMKNGFTIIF